MKKKTIKKIVPAKEIVCTVEFNENLAKLNDKYLNGEL